MLEKIIMEFLNQRNYASFVEIREVDKLHHDNQDCLFGTTAILYLVPGEVTSTLRIEVLKDKRRK